MQLTGAQLLVEALKKEKVEMIFGYTGAAVIPIFDCLYDEESIQIVVPRHEQGLVHAADGYARATSKTGVCLVTSGPGATNTLTGLATAYYDSVPLVCFTGQVATHLIGNDAFQEADIIGMSRSVTKHGFIVTSRSELGEIIRKAFHLASTGRPGPVVVDLPSNIIKEMGSDEYPQTVHFRGYKPVVHGHMGQIKRAAVLINQAKRPVLLAGGGIRISNAGKPLGKLVDKTCMPVVTTLQGLGAIPTHHPNNLGMLGMHGTYAANQAVGEADVIISIGTRFSDRITGKLSEFAPSAKIIHIDVDSAAISRNVPVRIPIVGDAHSILDELIPLVESVDEMQRKEWMERISRFTNAHPMKMVKSEKNISPMIAIHAICSKFGHAIYTTDVGQHQMWTAQFGTFDTPGSLITSGGLGTMGFGFPAAIGAQLGRPDKRVVCISGDGSFQMNLQELATAVNQCLPLVCVILNNAYLGMVRQWQGLFYEKRYAATCLKRTKDCPHQCSGQSEQCPPYIPDFPALAKAYGALGLRAENEEEMEQVLEQAAAHKKGPVLIEMVVDRQANVMPMVPAGAACVDMITEGDD